MNKELLKEIEKLLQKYETKCLALAAMGQNYTSKKKDNLYYKNSGAYSYLCLIVKDLRRILN